MKSIMKKIKNWLAFILTAIVVITLATTIFIKGSIVKPTADFFVQLAIVISLTLMMKLWWYDYSEDKRLQEDDILQAKENYFKMLDQNVEDSNDLDKFLVILNKENRDHYIKNKIGSRTPQNMSVKKTKWNCFWHPSYKKMTEEEIGLIRYTKLYFKIQLKADRLRQLKSEEIMALTDSEMLYDSKNHAKQHKRTYQIVTTVLSFVLTTILASMAADEIMLNWLNVFKYIGYLCSITFSSVWTVLRAYKQTGEDTLDYLNRLKYIIDKYATYKKEGKTNG